EHGKENPKPQIPNPNKIPSEKNPKTSRNPQTSRSADIPVRDVLASQAAPQITRHHEAPSPRQHPPIPLHLGPHPGGMPDNSPTFQRWVGPEEPLSPEGTADPFYN